MKKSTAANIAKQARSRSAAMRRGSKDAQTAIAAANDPSHVHKWADWEAGGVVGRQCNTCTINQVKNSQGEFV